MNEETVIKSRTLDDNSLPVPPVRLMLFVVLLCWFTAASWWHRNVVIDDPWITFRYAEQVVAGNGFVFNQGEYVEGYSNFTWLLLSIIPTAFNIDPFEFSRALGWLCAAALIALPVFGLRLTRLGYHFPKSISTAILMASFIPLSIWSISGLETSFYSLLLILFITFLSFGTAKGHAGSLWASAFLVVLLSLTRPEAPMFFILFIPAFIFTQNKATRKGILKTGVVAITMFLLFVGWRYSYYGELLPNSVLAKTGGSLIEDFRSGLKYTTSYFLGLYLILILALIFPFYTVLKIVKEIRYRRESSHENVFIAFLFLAIMLQTVFTVLVGGDWMPGWRFLVPVLPLLALSFGYTTSSWGIIPRILIPTLFLPYAVFQAHQNRELSWYRWMGKLEGDRLVISPLIEMGNFLADISEKDEVLAASEAGVMPYLSQLEFIDMLGLVDSHIASLEGGLHQKTDAKYVYEQRPNYVVLQLVDRNGGEEPIWKPDIKLFELPEFQREYSEIHRVERTLATPDWQLLKGHLVLYGHNSENPSKNR